MLVHEVEELAPLLSAAVLRGVAERMQALVHGTRLREAMASESPLQPEHLSFAAAGGARHICEDGAADGNDGDSVGSLADFEVPAVESEEDQEREEHEQVRVHIDPRAPAALDDGIAGDDAFLPDWLRPREFAGFEVEAAEYAQSEADEADGARDPRMGAWARDDVGLAQDGRRMYCDYHDLRHVPACVHGGRHAAAVAHRRARPEARAASCPQVAEGSGRPRGAARAVQGSHRVAVGEPTRRGKPRPPPALRGALRASPVPESNLRRGVRLLGGVRAVRTLHGLSDGGTVACCSRGGIFGGRTVDDWELDKLLYNCMVYGMLNLLNAGHTSLTQSGGLCAVTVARPNRTSPEPNVPAGRNGFIS